MRKRIVATTTMLSLLLALFIIMPGGVAIVEGTSHPNEPTPEDTGADSPIRLASSTISNTNPGRETISLYLTLVNVSEDVRFDRELRVTVTGFRSSEVMLAEGASFSRTIPEEWLRPGYQATIMLPIVVSPDFDSSSTLTVRISGTTTEGRFFDYTETANIIVVRPEPPDPEPPPEPIPPGVPRVIISRQLLSVDSVIAGTPFDLTITLLNTSRNRNVRNMEVTITDAEGIFVPVAGVNSFYIETLDSQETTDIVISLMARQDTETGSHPLTVTINYEDNLNAPHSTAPTINIPVILPVRLEIENLSFEDEGQGSAFLSFQIINMSLAPLNNLQVRVEGPFTVDQNQVLFIGTMAPGSFDFYEDTIFPFEFGEVSGEIVLEFEDSSGAPGDMRIPISTWVSEPFFPDFDDMDRWPEDGDFIWEEEMPEGGTAGWLLWAIIGGGVLLAGIITLIIVRRVRRKRREAADFGDE